MSISPELAYVAAVAITEAPVEPTNGHVAELATLPIPVAPAPQPEVKAKRGRPAGTLGYTSYTASQQRDATHRELAATEATLTAAQADAAKRKLTADYVTLYTTDSGKVQLDYQNFVACNNFGSCRTSSQDLLNDLQAFQSDRKTAKVPSDLAGVDADLGDALSAAIAATQQVISAMDSDDLNKFKDGERKVDAAMLNIAKAQVALANHLK